jgi:hypothetical protein
LDDLEDANCASREDGGSNCDSKRNYAANCGLDEVRALVGRINAESSSAVLLACWAFLPADRAIASISIFAWRVTEETRHLKARSTD